MLVELPPYERCIPPPDFPKDWVVPSRGNLDNYRRSRSLGIVAAHHAVLHRKAVKVPVENIDSMATRQAMLKMRRVFEAEREAGRRMAGLAAPQIGIGAQIMLVDLSSDSLSETPKFLFNTSIVNRSDETAQRSAGCFSCYGAVGFVATPQNIEVTAHTMVGRQTFVFEDRQALVVGHEQDHLEGRLHPDRIISEGGRVLWLPAECMPQYQGFVRSDRQDLEWPLQCPPAQWAAFRSGELLMEHFQLPPEAERTS